VLASGRRLSISAFAAAAIFSAACGNGPTRALPNAAFAREAPARPPAHVIRLTGTIQAVHSFLVQAPEISGAGGNLTLTHLLPNGATVREGDILAEFDSTPQLKTAREAETKFDDLSHQIDQKIAENKSNAEKRASELQQAEADLEKAKLEIRKGPILSAIDDEKNKAKLDDAQAHAASLRRSGHFHELAEAAELRVLELQRDRQKVALERTQDNMRKLVIHAPLGGMIVLDNVWRNGSMGHAQEGDQLWPGHPLMRIFDPSEMRIQASVGEPDRALLQPGVKAVVHLDAYPDLTFVADFESASPVASSALGSPLKTFDAFFRFEQKDPHLLPDLSAALDLMPPKPERASRRLDSLTRALSVSSPPALVRPGRTGFRLSPRRAKPARVADARTPAERANTLPTPLGGSS